MKKKRSMVLLGMLASLCLCVNVIVPQGEAYAVVSWTDGSLQEVYDAGEGFYTYAPSVIRDGATERIYSCHNSESGVIRDDIYYTERVNGETR